MSLKHFLQIALVALYLAVALLGILVLHGMSSMTGDCPMGTLQGIHCQGTSHSKDDGMVDAHLEMNRFFSNVEPGSFVSFLALLPVALLVAACLLDWRPAFSGGLPPSLRQRLRRSRELLLSSLRPLLAWISLLEKRDPARLP